MFEEFFLGVGVLCVYSQPHLPHNIYILLILCQLCLGVNLIAAWIVFIGMSLFNSTWDILKLCTKCGWIWSNGKDCVFGQMLTMLRALHHDIFPGSFSLLHLSLWFLKAIFSRVKVQKPLGPISDIDPWFVQDSVSVHPPTPQVFSIIPQPSCKICLSRWPLLMKLWWQHSNLTQQRKGCQINN